LLGPLRLGHCRRWPRRSDSHPAASCHQQRYCLQQELPWPAFRHWPGPGSSPQPLDHWYRCLHCAL
ncbi:hypothetical protein GGI21_003124, partial [Coemansia aciculifera]